MIRVCLNNKFPHQLRPRAALAMRPSHPSSLTFVNSLEIGAPRRRAAYTSLQSSRASSVRQTAKIITNQRNFQSSASSSFQHWGTLFSAARCTDRTVTVSGRFQQCDLCSNFEPTVKHHAWSLKYSTISTPTAPEEKISDTPATPIALAFANSRVASAPRA